MSKGFLSYPNSFVLVGQGIVLEIDEWPVIGRKRDTILEKEMALSMEFKFVFPNKEIGGIENTFVVTERAMRKLNKFPDGIFEC